MIPQIGDIYNEHQVTFVKVSDGKASIFGVKAKLPEETIKILRDEFPSLDKERGFVFKPGKIIAELSID